MIGQPGRPGLDWLRLTVMATMPGATSAGRDVARRLIDDGYVIVSGMMPVGDVQSARADLSRVLEATPTGRNAFEGFATQRVYALFAKTRTFDRAAIHPLLLEVLDHVLGHFQLSAPVGIRIGPGERAQMLHRDDSVYPLPQPFPMNVPFQLRSTSRSGSRTGSGRKSAWSTSEKMAEFAPTPSPIESRATSVNAGFLRSMRSA